MVAIPSIALINKIAFVLLLPSKGFSSIATNNLDYDIQFVTIFCHIYSFMI